MAQVELNLLLMGKTGHGKSATGNSILGRRSFKVSSNVQSETKEVEDDFVTFENYTVKVIDGPGIKDTTIHAVKDQETAAANMANALAMCNGGVDAFLFVFKYVSRFTEEERKALEGLKHIFGEDYFKHLIVVATMGDNFRSDMEEEGKGEITFHDWCKQQTGPFKQLFEDCDSRFILFNNREKNENAMYKQRKEIIELAHQLKQKNDRYTSDAFKKAKTLRERYIIEHKVPILTEEIQKTCALLKADLQKYIETPTGQLKDKIQEGIADTKTKIRDYDKGTNLLHHLLVHVDRIEENLNDIEKLRTLTLELDAIRKAKAEWSAFGPVCAKLSGLAGGLGVAGLMTIGFMLPVFPLAVGGVAAGATAVLGAGIALGVNTGINYLRLSGKEKKTKKMQNESSCKLEEAGLQLKKK